jgi:hypothetical protein
MNPLPLFKKVAGFSLYFIAIHKISSYAVKQLEAASKADLKTLFEGIEKTEVENTIKSNMVESEKEVNDD